MATMQIIIKLPSGPFIALTVRRTDPLSMLKPLIYNAGHLVPGTDFTFTRASGFPLPDDAVVQECCASDGATLYIRVNQAISQQPPLNISSTPLLVPALVVSVSTPQVVDLRRAALAAAADYALKIEQLEQNAREQAMKTERLP